MNGPEVWKELDDYENYFISNYGRLKSSRKIKDVIKLPEITEKGYTTFAVVSKEGKIKYLRAHRLVAIYFIANYHNKPQVNHKDGDRSNNTVINLEWSTQRENHIHKSLNSKTSSIYPGVTWCKNAKKWKSQIRMNGKSNHLGNFINEKDAAKMYRDVLKELEPNSIY